MSASAVGVCDVSTLGKIDVQGRDAGIFLDRVYANTFSTLPVGKARYGLMLREDGFVLDDGTTARLAEDHYFMTTTTANAVKVMQHLEFCQQCSLARARRGAGLGHRAMGAISRSPVRARATCCRRIVDPEPTTLQCGLPLSRLRRSHRLRRHAGTALSACRSPASSPTRSRAGAVRRQLWSAPSWRRARRIGIAPYGTEALGVLRIEKGHPAGGELNGQTTAHDLGFGKMLSAKKDFIGRFMAARPALTDPRATDAGGLQPHRPGRPHPRRRASRSPRMPRPTAKNDQGYVTSIAFSPSLGHWLGLGLLARGPERHGEIVRAYDPVRGGDVLVEVRPPCFIDPEGERLRV